MTTAIEPQEVAVDLDVPIHLTAFDMIRDGTIDVVRTGHFTDAHGREVDITQAHLEGMVLNFAARTAGQDIPIDIDHEFAQAAGWLTDLSIRGNTLVAVPEWNALGKQLVGDKVYRYISATIHLSKSLLLSASLVNFPAVKGMRPVALSEGQAAKPIFYITPQEEFTMSDNSTAQVAENAAPATPAAVATPAAETAAQTPQTVQLEGNLNLDLGALAGMVPASVVEQFTAALRAQTEQQLAQLRATLEQERATLEQQRTAIIGETIAQLREEQEITAFSLRVTSTGHHAFNCKPDEVKTFLFSLPKANRQAAQAFLSSIFENGTVDFSEVGTAAPRNGGVQRLDKHTEAELKRFLSNGGTVAEFFNINEDILGPASGYDLTAYAGK